MISLKANLRDAKIPVSKVREDGNIPCVIYGPKFANTSASLNYQDFIRFYNKHGETTLVAIDLDGKEVKALVHDFQLHPVTTKVTHVDFYVPEAGKKVHANVPLEFVNESAAVKAGAQLVKVLHEVEVSALPENLPHSLEVDLSLIVTVDVSIHIKDIKIPAGVTVDMDAEEVVASAVAYVEETEAAPVDLSSIEVEKKGKTEEVAAE